MTTDELMELAAEKAIKEVNWESIEFLFKPSNMFELLLRIDFHGMVKKAKQWAADDSPDALPWRFRREPGAQMQLAIDQEAFYRKLKEHRDKQ